MKVLLPKAGLEESPENLPLPLFFLAGPILGGGDWHVRMSKLLVQEAGDCIIVNPSRYGEDHPLYHYRCGSTEDCFENQTMWERYYLEQAGLKWPQGCIIFWLAEESATHPRTDGQPYAMDTRGEIGEWRAHFVYNYGVRIAIGADAGFPGLRTIKRNNEGAARGRLPIFDTMGDVAKMAAALASDSEKDEHLGPKRLK